MSKEPPPKPLSLEPFGVADDDIRSVVLTQAPLTMKVPIIEQTVQYFYTSYEEACTNLLTNWKNTVWVVDVMAQSFTLPFPTHTGIVLLALDVLGRMVMCVPLHPVILRDYDNIARLIIRSLSLLFQSKTEHTASNPAAARDQAKAAVVASSIWTTLGVTQAVSAETWHIAIRTMLAITCHVLDHPQFNTIPEIKYVLLSKLFEALLHSASTDNEVWSLVATSLRTRLVSHHSIATQWSRAYTGVNTAVVPLLQHPVVSRPLTASPVKIVIAWMGLPRSVGHPTSNLEASASAVLWQWRALYQIVLPTQELADSASRRIVLDTVRDVVVLISSSYHWPRQGVSTDSLMQLFGPEVVQALVRLPCDSPCPSLIHEGRSSAVAALCCIFGRHRSKTSAKNLSTFFAVLSTCCVEVAASNGGDSVMLTSLLCNCGSLFTVPFTDVSFYEGLLTLIFPLVCLALTGSKDLSNYARGWFQAGVEDCEAEQEDGEGTYNGPSTPRSRAAIRHTYHMPAKDTTRCVYRLKHNDEWLLYSAMRILTALFVHNINAQMALEVLLDTLKIAHAPRTQVFLTRVAAMYFHHQVTTAQGSHAGVVQLKNVKRVLIQVAGFLDTASSTWMEGCDVILFALRFLHDVVVVCDRSKHKFFPSAEAFEVVSMVVQSVTGFLTNLRALFFKSGIDAPTTTRLFCVAYGVLIECILNSQGKITSDLAFCKKLLSVIEIGTSMGTQDTYEVKEWATALQHTMLSGRPYSYVCEDEFAAEVTRVRYYQLDSVRLFSVLELPGKTVMIVRDPYTRWTWSVLPTWTTGNPTHVSDNTLELSSNAQPENGGNVAMQLPIKTETAMDVLTSLLNDPPIPTLNEKEGTTTEAPTFFRASVQTPPSKSCEFGSLFIHSLGLYNWSMHHRFCEIPKPTKKFFQTLRALDRTPPRFSHVVHVVYVAPTEGDIKHWSQSDDKFGALIELLGDRGDTCHGALNISHSATHDVVHFTVRSCTLDTLPAAPEEGILRIVWLHKDIDPNPNTQDTESMTLLHQTLIGCDKTPTRLPALIRERTMMFSQDIVLWGIDASLVAVQLPRMNEHLTTMLMDLTPCTVPSLATMLRSTCVRTSHAFKTKRQHTIPWLTRRRVLSILTAPQEDSQLHDATSLSSMVASLLS